MLNQLTDSCGGHILLALHEPAEGTEYAHNDHTGCDDLEANAAAGLIRGGCQQPTACQHGDGRNTAQRQQQQGRHPEDILCAPGVILGKAAGNQAAHGHGQTGGGNGQQQIIGRKYGLINAQAVSADHPGQRNGVQHTHQLADDARQTENRHAANDGL